MATVKNEILEAAIEYAGYGWKIVLLHPRDKLPRGEGWQHRATSDDEQLLSLFEQYPESNIGLLLGPDSGVVDVEYDNEEGRQFADRILGEIYTPTYKALRGVHRLFRWSDDLPKSQKWEQYGLEVRLGGGGKAAQSVLPPSIHPSGGKYEWVFHPSEYEIQQVPETLMALLWNDDGTALRQAKFAAKGEGHWKKILDGVAEGERNQSAASLIGKMLADLADPFNNTTLARVWIMLLAWNEKNRPPIDEVELRKTFDSIVLRHRSRVLDSQTNERVESDLPIDKPETDRDWRLVIIDSKPTTCRLYSPFWSQRTEGGYIEISSDQMLNPEAIRKEAFEQAHVWVSGQFSKLWCGTKDTPSLAKRLTDTAEKIAAPLEQKRNLVVAEMLRDALGKAVDQEEGKKLESKGRPRRLSDGSVVFRFSAIWADMRFSPDKVTRNELSQVLQAIEAGEHRQEGIRWVKLTKSSLDSLTRLLVAP